MGPGEPGSFRAPGVVSGASREAAELSLALLADLWPVGDELRRRYLAAIVAADLATADGDYDLVFLGCGLNDVWRGYQNHLAEAVGLDEYTRHLSAMLGQLRDRSRQIVVVSETPFGPIEDPVTVAAMNTDLARYNEAAAQAAADHGALFLDVWRPFTTAARQLTALPGHEEPGLWSDGVHLSELGDTVLLQQTERLLAEHRVVEKLLEYPLLERDLAVTVYRPLFARFRPSGS
ncbi:SGNH/GDSL hydrolase family protein [Kitasatospora sp. NPDC098663]|uniref:SGNH/GDSL hydrolase family protein n=1 Tax=Kitasatospora sp. NPDC098663 TaxID=3364096 RepID=UPI0038068E99